MAGDAKVGDNGDGGDDETVERSPLSKKPNRRLKYLTSYAPMLIAHFLKKDELT